MVSASRGRSTIALFHSSEDVQSHRIRFLLAEKGIQCELIEVDPGQPPEDLIDLNPYQSLPTLVDRDLVLYHADVIADYLDERYPHPPLMPIDPVQRARLRLALVRMQREWFSELEAISKGGAKATKAKEQLAEELLASDELFRVGKFFLHDELTLIDIAVGPFLWRINHHGVAVPKKAGAVQEYMQRVFGRDTFRASLSDAETQMEVA